MLDDLYAESNKALARDLALRGALTPEKKAEPSFSVWSAAVYFRAVLNMLGKGGSTQGA